MKALSIHPVPAMMIFAKKKTIELRTWKTNYRGDIVICSTKRNIKGLIPSHALCVVELVDVAPFEKKDCEKAGFTANDYSDLIKNGQLYSWYLDNLRYIKPIPIKGKLGLWNFTEPIEYLAESTTEEEDEALYHKYYEPIIV